MNFYSDQRLSSALRRFKEKHPECYDLLENFVVDLLAQGISELRIRSYVHHLSKIVDFTGKRPDELTKDDIRKTIAHYQDLVNSGMYKQSTIFEVKKTLKKFFRWLGKEELVNWFSVGEIKSQISPQDLITEEEFRKCSMPATTRGTECYSLCFTRPVQG